MIDPAGTAGTARRADAMRLTVAVVYLTGAGVHLGIVAADPQVYRDFGAHAVPFIRDLWSEVFMSAPAAWGLAVAAGEFAIGLLLLAGSRIGRGVPAQLGIAGAIAFHCALMTFGWWCWFYAIPALAFLVFTARNLTSATSVLTETRGDDHGRS